MIKKIIISTLIVVALGTSSAMAYINPIEIPKIQKTTTTQTVTTIQPIEQVEVEKKEINVISPKITPAGEVLPSKNLLISVEVLTESSVFLSVYKVLEESEELILGPEEMKTGENFQTYRTEIKDIKPGNYKMKFAKEGEEEPFEVRSFKLLNQEMQIPSLNLIKQKTIDLLLGQ